MTTTLVRSWAGVGLILVDLAVALVLVAWPLFQHYHDDQGDGKALVLLPKPRQVSYARTVSFILSSLTLDVLHESSLGSRLDLPYARGVVSVAGIAVRSPAELQAVFTNFHLGIRFLFISSILSMALVIQASPLQRARIALQALWYVILVFSVDVAVAVAGVVSGLSVSPNSVVGNLIALILGLLVMTRLVFVCFALPRPTALEPGPQRRIHDSVVLGVALLGSVGILAALDRVVIARLPPSLAPIAALLLILSATNGLTVVLCLILNALRLLESTEPPVGEARPPVDVIIPAYNEEEWIADTLNHIDRAAFRYGGPVRAILADDGSTDGTNALALATIAGFRCATGTVLNVRHGGKSATLNAALAECTSDVVVRIDADTFIDEWCIHYAIRWFRDPSIGQVEAFTVPRMEASTWFHKMRLFECLRTFGFLHRAMQVVDAVSVVPGMFTAFRRQPVEGALGGFTVGMNGEDTDLTLCLGRLGYRTWLDPKVRIYEDVPPTWSSFREQRIRWSRSSIHTLARHAPFRAGLAGPRLWFSQARMAFGRMFAPLRLTAFLYAVVVAVMDPTYQRQLITLAVELLLVYATTQVLILVIALWWKMERWAPWLIYLGPFALIKQMFFLEAYLSLPPRDVAIPGISSRQVIPAPVIH